MFDTDFPISFGQKWIQLGSSNVFGNNHTVLAIAYMITFIIICIKDRVEQE
jgi:hypothetical protein